MTGQAALSASLQTPPTFEITATVADSFESAGLSREEWDQFVMETGAGLYMTYDWCRLWWRHYGSKRRLRIYVVRRGERLIGIIPMFVERLRLGPASLTIAKRVGSDFALTIFALPIASGESEIVYRDVIHRLIADEQCDAVWFGFLPGDDPTLDGLRAASRSMSNEVAVLRDAPAGPHTFFELPSSFAAYLASLNKRHRQNYNRDTSRLKKTFKLRTEVVKDPSETSGRFLEFKQMHARQWKSEGKSGHFGDWPGAEEFNADLVDEMSRLGRCRFVSLLTDEATLTMQYAFVFGECCYWRLPARLTEGDAERLGLGRLGLIQLIEQMIAEGARRIEAGIGHYPYKMQLGGQELDVRTFLVASLGAGKLLRAKLFLILSDLLHFLYYRIWFGRITPHLPLSQRPLWRTWIRCRL